MINKVMIDESFLTITSEHISLVSPIRLKTLSSAICGAGFGWHSVFINRHVDKNYNNPNHVIDMETYIKQLNYNLEDSVGMMTAVKMENVTFQYYDADQFSLFVVITAGVGNAVDSTAGESLYKTNDIGTINTWIFVNGKLSDEAFVQAVMTATEAKTKALHELEIIDPVSKTIATGTSTDSILIAATQKGAAFRYAGTATPLGKLIGKSVYELTKKAIIQSKANIDK